MDTTEEGDPVAERILAERIAAVTPPRVRPPVAKPDGTVLLRGRRRGDVTGFPVDRRLVDRRGAAG